MFGYTPGWKYNGCKLDITEYDWDLLSYDQRLILSYHPRILEVMSVREMMMYNRDILLTSDPDLLINAVTEEGIPGIEVVLSRDDVNNDIVDTLDPLVLQNIRSARMVRPHQLIQACEGWVSPTILSTCRYLDLSRLGEYIELDSGDLGFIASEHEILNELDDYSDIWINPRLSYDTVMILVREGKITYDQLKQNWVDYVRSRLTHGCLNRFVDTFPELTIPDELDNILEDCSGNNHPIRLLCQEFKIPDVMPLLPMRFKMLLSMGYVECVRNCFKPMGFRSRSLDTYSDIDIIVME
jgi:hypothetical protein